MEKMHWCQARDGNIFAGAVPHISHMETMVERRITKAYKPARVLVQPEALNYALTKEIMARLEAMNVPTKTLKSSRVIGIPGSDDRESFFEAKRTVVLAVRGEAKEFQGCRPSANFQLPLTSGCVGHCHYCYLNTSLGRKPYVRVYVNRDDIFQWADAHIEKRRPFVTIFEGSATSDPLPLEPWSGAMRDAIQYFAAHPYGRFRFVSKFDQVESLLDLDHRRHTRIRFTVNTPTVIKHWDKATSSLERRLQAARKVAEAGYPFGFLIGPIVVYEGWEREYEELVVQMRDLIPPSTHPMASFELITHRFTPRAKDLIETVYPGTDLPMDEEAREWRYGQFGYGKWVYPKDVYEKARHILLHHVKDAFPTANIMYLV